MIKTAQTSVFPRINPHQVTSYPQQSTTIPSVSPSAENGTGFDPSMISALIGPMITLIMVVMMMRMMTNMMDNVAA